MERDRQIATTIRMKPRLWSELRMLAEMRALGAGGRASVNAVVTELIEREAARTLKAAGNA